MRLLNVQCALLRSKRVIPRQFWTAQPARWAQPARECTNFFAAAGYDLV